ncbi:MAG: 3-hydroxyacyl-CoA dehydrogenase [Rhodospirillaceae bacterium]
MTDKIAVIGSGLVGRAWAISFARAGFTVQMTDANAGTLGRVRGIIESSLGDLADNGLLNGQSVADVMARVGTCGSFAEALDGAVYAQESTAEVVEVKKAVYAELDALAAPDTVLGSSTSGILASLFTEELAGRHRCLVAHPINPPYLVPAVELCPAPWTDPAAVDFCATIMERAGHKPIRMSKEIDGFIVNRLQIALLHEAFRLVDGGYASCADVDTAISDGLSHRWSFIGPFEVGDLNAPAGIRDYCTKFGGLFDQVGATQTTFADFRGPLLDEIERQRREKLPADKLGERTAWRDRRLMALAVHKKHASETIGD